MYTKNRLPITPRVPGAAQHGHCAAINPLRTIRAALQTRDRITLRVWNDPGSAVQRCAPHCVRDTLVKAEATPRRPRSQCRISCSALMPRAALQVHVDVLLAREAQKLLDALLAP